MKYLASLLFIFFLGSCTPASVHTAKEIGCQINNCCSKLSSMQASPGYFQPVCPDAPSTPAETSPAAYFPDFGPEILTW